MTRPLSFLSVLVLVALLGMTPALAGSAVNNPPSSGGSGGAVSSVSSGGGCVTVSPTTGAVVITSTGCSGSGVSSAVAGTGIAVSGATGAVTFSLSPVADQRILGNVSGSSAAPIPLTQAQIATFLGGSFLIPGNNLSDVGSAATSRTNLGAQQTLTSASGTNLTSKFILQGTTDTGAPNAQFLGALATGLLKNTTTTGVLSSATAGTDYQAPLTFSTGLTNTSSTVTTNLSTGTGTGQTAYGGLSTTNSLTLQPNFADTTTGRVVVNGLGLSVTAGGTNTAPSIQIGSTASTGLFASFGNIQFTVNGNQVANFTPSGFLNLANGLTTSGPGVSVDSSGVTLIKQSGSQIWVAATNGFNLGTTSAASPTTLFSGNTLTVASATSAVLDALKMPAATATFTGTTPITTAAGVNWFDVEAPTYTDASAVAITNAATFTVKGAPIAAGSLTITNGYAEWVQGGTARFDGRIQESLGASVASSGTTTLGTDGNLFSITGTTAIDFITTTGWRKGAIVWIQFGSALTVDYNTASPPANTAAIKVAGAANYSAPTGSRLGLFYDGTVWWEIGRSN